MNQEDREALGHGIDNLDEGCSECRLAISTLRRLLASPMVETGEVERLRAEVAALKEGKWAGRWENAGSGPGDRREWRRMASIDPCSTALRPISAGIMPLPRGRAEDPELWDWWARANGDSVVGGRDAPTSEAAREAADAALRDAGWYLEEP